MAVLLALPPSAALGAISGLVASQPSGSGSSAACAPLELLQAQLAGLQRGGASFACMDTQPAQLAAAAAGGQGFPSLQRPSLAPEPTALPPWLSELLSLAVAGGQQTQPALQQQKPASPARAGTKFVADAPNSRLWQLAQRQEGEGDLAHSAWKRPPLAAATASLPAQQQPLGAASALQPHSPLTSGDASDQGTGRRAWAVGDEAEPSLPGQQQPERQQGQQQQERGWQAWDTQPLQSAAFHAPDTRSGMPAEQWQEQQPGQTVEQQQRQGKGVTSSVEGVSCPGSQEHTEPAYTAVQAAGRQTSQESQQAPAADTQVRATCTVCRGSVQPWGEHCSLDTPAAGQKKTLIALENNRVLPCDDGLSTAASCAATGHALRVAAAFPCTLPPTTH